MKVNDFNRVAKNSIEEWAYYLNTGDVPKGAKAPGMEEVKEQLTIDRMDKSERSAYYKHLDNIVILRDNIYTEREEGRLEGRAEGREEGRAEGREEGREEGRAEGRLEERRQNAKKMKDLSVPVETISQVTGLSVDEIDSL